MIVPCSCLPHVFHILTNVLCLQSCIAAVTQEADAIKHKLQELCKLRQVSMQQQHDRLARSAYEQHTTALIASQHAKLQDILRRVTALLQEVGVAARPASWHSLAQP
jgi:hypothetical protein